MQAFLKPLSAKEETEQLERMRAGYPDARETLIEHNLRLVAHIVKKYNLPERDADDFISIGTIGLIKAIDTFNPGKNIRLATYASRCIDNELLMTLRSNKKQAKEVSLSEPIGSDREGNEITLLDVIEMEEDAVEDRLHEEDNRSRLKGFLFGKLNGREREILLYRYGLYGYPEITQREIADRFQISRSYVSRIEKKALAKLRECYDMSEI
ncbi:MAG: RNA polymerase sporulation sigma factor SigK [Lachnospiraceae bacterium]|nr:RNA polymerase sporulation sigma factor SigK [Lachnospiraceae bacterium]